MNIIIGGDIVPTKSNNELFVNGEAEKLVGKEILKIFNNSDLSILNLETPLCDKDNPILKCGPNLRASTDTIKGLSKINSSFYTLANNHIMDHGVAGLKSTIDILKSNNINFAGVGDNLSNINKYFIYNKKNKKIGIYCCAEHEFSIATQDSPGVNPFDPLVSLDEIDELKDICDYLIVLYHGGKEHYRFPTPILQQRCRKMIEKGADLIVCQHSHCIGCFEDWQGGKIVYGQGNFLFDDGDNEFWNTSLLINLKIDNNIEIEYIPIVKNKNCVDIAVGEEKQKIIKDFKKRSEMIKKDQFVIDNFNKFSDEIIYMYLSNITYGINKTFIFRVFNKLSNNKLLKYYLQKKYNKMRKSGLLNYFQGEPHNEIIINGLRRF